MGSESNSNRKELVEALRSRAKGSRRSANFALLAVFVMIFSGLSLFYFAGDIVIREAESAKPLLLPER